MYIYIYDVYICLYRYLVRVVENTCLHLWTRKQASKPACMQASKQGVDRTQFLKF